MSETPNTITAIKKELLMRLGHDADIFALISLCTREPYVVCDEETFDDEVFLFLDEEEAKKEAAKLAEEKVPVTVAKINGKDMLQGDRIPNDLTSYVSDNLRGEPGTTCVLKVERPTSDSTYVPMEFKITRSTIRTNPVPYYGIVGNNVGYIVISTFAIENCSKDIKKALIELKHLERSL